MARRNKNKIYSIILTNHGKQKETICSEATEEKIYKRYEKLLKENKKVVFPVRFNNEQHVMVESEHELVIIKCRDEYEKKETKIKTDSGEFAIYETTDDDWIVIDRTPYNIEETFWVYGYHPRIQRKTFQWIFENFVLKDSKNKYMFKLYEYAGLSTAGMKLSDNAEDTAVETEPVAEPVEDVNAESVEDVNTESVEDASSEDLE